MVHLEEVNKENLFEVIKIWDTLDDIEKKSVAPNVISIAQAYVNQDRAWTRVIYNENEIVGFLMLALHDDDIPEVDQPAYYLWRLMMKKEAQGKGYGKQVIQIIKNKAKAENQKTLYVTCTMHSPMPYQFYIHHGFSDTGEMDGDEEILRMELSIE